MITDLDKDDILKPQFDELQKKGKSAVFKFFYVNDNILRVIDYRDVNRVKQIGAWYNIILGTIQITVVVSAFFSVKYIL